MYIRVTNDKTFVYLCQCGNWQAFVEAKNEIDAATQAMDEVMKQRNNPSFEGAFGSAIGVRKIVENDFEENFKIFPAVILSAPTILANAGHHIAANALLMIIKNNF